MKNKFYFPRRIQTAVFIAVTFYNARLFAQTNSEATNASLKLLPPYGELPPTFWEQHENLIFLAGLGVAVLVAPALWLIFRRKPQIIIPPEVRARKALQELRTQPEDGIVLSCVSQIIRQYFIAAFELLPGELTTTEFCREISDKETVGAQLSTGVASFLRACDAQKFSSTVAPVKLDAANQAMNLIEQGEQRRAQLLDSTAIQVQGRSV